MFAAVYYLLTISAVILITLYTVLARLPDSLRMLQAYQKASTGTDTSFIVPSCTLKLPESWSVAQGAYLSINDDSVYLSRKVRDDTWVSVDVQKVVEKM